MQTVAEHILWKDVPGFEGLYKVSNLGDVYSVRRGKALIPDDVRGYKQVTLQKMETGKGIRSIDLSRLRLFLNRKG